MTWSTIPAESTLKAKIRRRLGSPDTTILPDETLDECLDDAVSAVNELDPRLALSTLTTVANQSEYRVAWDGGGLSNPRGIMQVCYRYETFDTLGGLFPTNLGADHTTNIAPGLDLIQNPDVVYGYFQQIRQYEQMFLGVWEKVEKSDGLYIRLIPAPSTAGNVIPFFWAQSRTLTDMESRYEKHLVELTVGLCMQAMGTTLSLVGAIKTGSTEARFDGPKLIEAGKELEEKVRSRLRCPPSPTIT